MISEEQAEKAAEYIRDNAAAYGKAKADRIYLQEFRKSQKALLINECEDGTAQTKESYAYAHEDYLEVLEGLRVAIEEEEKIRWTMTAAQIKTELWRTQAANNRNIDKSHR